MDGADEREEEYRGPKLRSPTQRPISDQRTFRARRRGEEAGRRRALLMHKYSERSDADKMRRARAAVDDDEESSRRQAAAAAAAAAADSSVRTGQQRRSTSRFLCSRRAAVMVVAVLILVWGLNALWEQQQGALQGTAGTARTKSDADVKRSGVGARLKAWYGELSMLGSGVRVDGQEELGDWRTCREYEEDKLARHKKEGRLGYDEFLRQVKPKRGKWWELAMTEDQDVGWLGLHHFDNRYQYGSEEADRRVKKLGYCRVHMPSVPRTGSTWFRAMFETATSQPSFSMWPEGGTLKRNYKAFSSDDPCGANLDHMEGNLRSRKTYACRDLRPPNATSPILYKSHTPFFPSYNKPSLMPSETCMLALLVRNPIDNYDAWQRYSFKSSILMREYLPTWQGHLSHWIAAAGDIPIYVFRYEDMLLRAEEVLRKVLQALPGGWNWSEESIAKAMRQVPDLEPQLLGNFRAAPVTAAELLVDTLPTMPATLALKFGCSGPRNRSEKSVAPVSSVRASRR
ncbi:unnamed protein product [Pylaiella littoralis]